MKFLNDNIKEGRFKRTYLICGEEDYLRKQYRDKLKEAITQGDDMNYSYYTGKGIDCREVIDVCETLPFFAERRLVTIEDSGFFKGSCDDVLLEYLENIPEYLTILFVENEVDKRSKMYKAVSRNGYVSEMTVQDEATLKRWVASMLSKEGKQMDMRAMERFLDCTGYSMDNIHQEIEKLICYTMGRQQITADDVGEVCTVTTANKIFDMVSYVALGRQSDALELYYDLIMLKEPPLRILFMLSRQFNLLLQVKELENEGYSRATIAKKMQVKDFIVTKCHSQAQEWSIAKLHEALEDCAAYEEDVKRGRLNPNMCVELIIIKYSQRKVS